MARMLNKYDAADNPTQAGYDPQDAYGFKVIAWPVLFDENYITEDKMTFTFDSEGRTERLETIAQFWFDAGVDEIQAFAQE